MIHIGKQEAELALKVNSAAFQGDIYHLKSLIRAGADPNKTDYDGRSPLVCLFAYLASSPRNILVLICKMSPSSYAASCSI